jgi:hypothetical protein
VIEHIGLVPMDVFSQLKEQSGEPTLVVFTIDAATTKSAEKFFFLRD